MNFHQLDCQQITSYARENEVFLNALKHPVLVIEDSHENVLQLLKEIDRFLQPGDYLVVEDTLDKWKHDVMVQFLEERRYDIDYHYCDFWGSHNSWNVNSFFRKPRST